VAQAFDTVWHDGLLFKFKNIFPVPYYLLLKSYLSDRSFRVKINTTLSSLQTISEGVPQGSDIALSSILYSQQTSLPQSIPLSGPTPTTQPYSPPATTFMNQIFDFKTTWTFFLTGSSHGKSKSMTPNQLTLHLHSAREYLPL